MLYLAALFFILFSGPAAADNVILMLADGMGFNHVSCAGKEKDLFFSSLPVRGEIRTHSANRSITDSAAGATAYACGIKTKNGYVGMDPEKLPCETIAEQALKKGFFTALLTTDLDDSPTPAAFYAHASSRYKRKDILDQQRAAAEKMIIQTDITDLPKAAADVIVRAETSGKPYFLLIEEEGTDIASHNHDLAGMKKAVYNFDTAVKAAVELSSPDTTVIVLADHETGGLSRWRRFKSTKHTGRNVPLFAAGKHARLFSGELDNTQINYKIGRILFTPS